MAVRRSECARAEAEGGLRLLQGLREVRSSQLVEVLVGEEEKFDLLVNQEPVKQFEGEAGVLPVSGVGDKAGGGILDVL